MAVLKTQIASRTKGSMAENEDWWHLCYDTETKEFFVAHEWSYVKINGLTPNNGSSREDADGWSGPGAEMIPGAKKQLLERAGA